MVLTRRRAVWTVVALLLVAGLYTAWQGWQVQRDLKQAEAGAERLQAAIDDGDAEERDRALGDLQDAAHSAAGHTDGWWWGGLTHLPLVGDDAAGLRSVSESLDLIAADGLAPLVDAVDDLEGLSSDGRVDLAAVARLTGPVSDAHAAFRDGAALVADVDSSGFAGPLRVRFDRYVDRVGAAAADLGSADTAAAVLPDMLGAGGPRDYLLVFQNNAEIRATGGMPGSWALLHAERGALTITRQGTAGDFVMRDTPVLPLSAGEREVYGVEYGLYFQDIGFAPDFPRAAELARAWWDETYPAVGLDGVFSLDPVAMSYLLEGTGPVQVGDVSLTSDNVVEELLSKPYLELDIGAQDALFAAAALAIFDAATGELVSPVAFVQGLSRAAEEHRFLVAPFDPADAERLEGSQVLGALTGDDGSTPHVDIGLNDATASKMSYYLRYWAEVEAGDCRSGRQTLAGTMTLKQAIASSEAAALPVSVTGGGIYGTDPGSQLVQVRIYGPWGGSVDRIRIDGKAFNDIESVDVDGRPVVTLSMQPSSQDDVVINWSMETGPGQTGSGRLGMTPSIVLGSNDASFRSAC